MLADTFTALTVYYTAALAIAFVTIALWP